MPKKKPRSAFVLCFINQKGGVGKSTLAGAVGAGLAKKGKHVLFVDLDAQGNLTRALCADTAGPTAYDAMTGTAAAAAIRHTEQGDVMPASDAFIGADKKIQGIGSEYRLRDALRPLRPLYDAIIVDTPPALGIVSVNALCAADGIVIPTEATPFSLQGLAQLAENVQAVQHGGNPDLRIMGVVLTRWNARSILSRDFAEIIEDKAREIGTTVYNTRIREAVAWKESQAMQKSVFDYAPKSNAAADAAQLVAEIIKQI